MNLYLRHDLFKNTVTIEGTVYNVRPDPAEGYEPYEASDGSTKYRKPVGADANEASDTEGANAAPREEDVSEEYYGAKDEDPLASDDPMSEPSNERKLDEYNQPGDTGSNERDESLTDFGGDEEPSATNESSGKPPSEDSPSPFTYGGGETAMEHQNTTPIEHMNAVKLAEQMGDDKMAHFHREQIKQKLTEPGDHHAFAEQLKEHGFHEEAAAHKQKYQEAFKEKVQGQIEDIEGSPEYQAQQRRRQRRAEKEERQFAQKKRRQEQRSKDEAAVQPILDEARAEGMPDAPGESLNDLSPEEAEAKRRKPQLGESEDTPAKEQGAREYAGTPSAQRAQRMKDAEREAQGDPDGYQGRSSIDAQEGQDQDNERAQDEGPKKQAEWGEPEEKKEETDYGNTAPEGDAPPEDAGANERDAEGGEHVGFDQQGQRAEDLADERHEELADKYNKKGKTEDRIRESQKAGQKAAQEKFEKEATKHEAARRKAKADQSRYKTAYKKYQERQKHHAAALEDMKSALDELNSSAPTVEGHPDVKEAKKKAAAAKLAYDSHRVEMPRKKEALQAAKDALQEHNKKISDLEKEMKEKLKAHAEKAPKGPAESQEEMDSGAYEQKHRKHKEAGKAIEEEYKSKIRDLRGNGNTKENALKRRVDVAQKDHDTHKEKLGQLKQEHDEARVHHDKTKAKIQDQVEKEKPKHDKKVEAHKKKIDRHKKNAPKEPKKPDTKDPGDSEYKKPESQKEKATHRKHTKAASELRDNIESHLRNNQDLSDEQREKLYEMHTAASTHASQEHHPTSDERAHMKDLQDQATDFGVHEHYDKKAARDQAKADRQAAKQQAQSDKQAAKAKENEPQPPANEIEEAELHSYKQEAKEKADRLRHHMNSGAVSDEDKQHIQNAIDKYEEHANMDHMPTKGHKNEMKQLDSAMKTHHQAAKKNQSATSEGVKGGGSQAAPKEKISSRDRRSTSRFMSEWNRGVNEGKRFGTAINDPEGAGEAGAITTDYAVSGTLYTGHKLLTSSRKNDARRAQQKQKANKT